MRNVLFSAAVVSVLGCLCSCTSVVQRPVEEVSARQFEYSRNKTRISEVVTKDKDTIVFDSLGGLYAGVSQTLVGISRDGTPVGFNALDLRKVKIVAKDGSTTDMEPRKFMNRYKRRWRERIEGLKLLVSETPIRFGMLCGWVHPRRKLVVSSLWKWQSSQVYPFGEIEYVLVRRTDAVKTTAFAIASFVVVCGIIDAVESIWDIDIPFIPLWDFVP